MWHLALGSLWALGSPHAPFLMTLVSPLLLIAANVSTASSSPPDALFGELPAIDLHCMASLIWPPSHVDIFNIYLFAQLLGLFQTVI